MPESPTPAPGKPKGLERIKGLKITGTGPSELDADPEIAAAIREDVAETQRMDSAVDVDRTMDEAMESLEGPIQGKRYPIGNGSTLPFPDEGEDTTDYATCRKPIKDVNRGCIHYGTTCRLPMLAAKYKEVGGPYNVRYKNLHTGLVKTGFCTILASSYLKAQHIVLVPPGKDDPPGETWVPTRNAERRALPDGRMPMPGPGQPTTPIEWTPRKTRVICTPSAKVIREYQLMRRRGDFEKRPKRELSKRR